MNKGRYFLLVAAVIALSAFNVSLSLSNKSYARQSGNMNLTPMNDEKQIIKYTYDEFGNRNRREVELVAVPSRSKSAAAQTDEPGNTRDRGRRTRNHRQGISQPGRILGRHFEH